MRKWLALAPLLVAIDARAAEGAALVLELVDPEPVRVQVRAISHKATCSVSFGVVVFEGVVKKDAPVVVATDAPRLCVSQTAAPLTSSGLGPALFVQHIAGMTPIPLQLRSRGKASELPIPALKTSPLTMKLEGNERIGVRVAAGRSGPCDASPNAPLFRGTLEPGAPLTIPTDSLCVCVEQTFAPFVTGGFEPATFVCRPSVCVGKVCQTNPLDPFVVSLHSRP